MKKIASILLLMLLFFNWYGYRMLSDFLQERSDNRLEARLDQNLYDEQQLIELRIPITLPYHTETKEFERYNGQIELNGVHYQYVKRKIENGELVLLCLPNQEKQQLANARDQFFKLVNDIDQAPGSNDGAKKSEKSEHLSFKKLLSEYQQENNQWYLSQLQNILNNFQHAGNLYFPGNYTQTPEQPPELS